MNLTSVAVSQKNDSYDHRSRDMVTDQENFKKNDLSQRRPRRTGKFVVLSVAVGKTWLVRARWSRSSPKNL